MDFDVAAYLTRATSRAKSDVANKLVSMFLHEISRCFSRQLGSTVNDANYARAVVEAFGKRCAYCRRPLEKNRSAIEHLDGMNRIRIGLHIPGNVVAACTSCNSEKRRDDQLTLLRLGDSGWESFLGHDSQRCGSGCKTCHYWRTIYPDHSDRAARLGAALTAIRGFRLNYARSLEWNAKVRPKLVESVNALYRDGQEFAASRIKQSVELIMAQMT